MAAVRDLTTLAVVAVGLALEEELLLDVTVAG